MSDIDNLQSEESQETPQTIHNLIALSDQAGAGLCVVGAILGQFYESMKQSGLSDDQAFKIVERYYAVTFLGIDPRSMYW